MTRDELICNLRNPKLNAAETMKQAADEIERLRALITDWADAEDAWTQADDDSGLNACRQTHEALRKAVGR